MALGMMRKELAQKTRIWSAEKNRRMIERLDSDGDGRVSVR